MEHFDIDAYAPAQMARRVEKAGIAKGNLDFASVFALAVLAGAFIALGAVFSTYVIHDSPLGAGLTRLLGGLAFCLGLILVIIAGAELFTGNNLLVIAYVSRRITLAQLLRQLGRRFRRQLHGLVGHRVLDLPQRAVDRGAIGRGGQGADDRRCEGGLDVVAGLSRGILCNTLVCLAVWLCFSGRSVANKVLAILFPITAFVALGFEHSVANMYFIPAGLVLRQNPRVLAAAEAALGESRICPT